MVVASPYYKINKVLWRWSRRENAKVVHDVRLSLDRAPPAPSPLPVPPRKPASRPTKPDPFVKMLDDIGRIGASFSRFKNWLNTPPSPTPMESPGHREREKSEKPVPPFDIQEIPAAMRKEMMPVGARLMDRWFAGRLNYSLSSRDETNEINQDGQAYPPEMYDTTTIRLNWVLEFARARRQYDYLIGQAIRSPTAKEVIKRRLAPYKHGSFFLSTAQLCNDNLARIHHLFQFQLAIVDGSFAQKIDLFLQDLKRNGVPDDLTAALGSFNFYAALADIHIHRESMPQRTVADVRGIWVYVKDNYTFTDKAGTRSQYLGHWSRDGVIVVPLDAFATISPYIPHLESSIALPYVNIPVTLGDPVIKGNVYYPVHNDDFRQWQIRHRRGGDFVIYSDRRHVPVVPPIRIIL